MRRLFLTGAVFALAASAGFAQARDYTVSTNLFDTGKMVALPALVVEEGKTARFENEDYQLDALVTPSGDAKDISVSLSDKRDGSVQKVNSRLDHWDGKPRALVIFDHGSTKLKLAFVVQEAGAASIPLASASR